MNFENDFKNRNTFIAIAYSGSIFNSNIKLIELGKYEDVKRAANQFINKAPKGNKLRVRTLMAIKTFKEDD